MSFRARVAYSTFLRGGNDEQSLPGRQRRVLGFQSSRRLEEKARAYAGECGSVEPYELDATEGQKFRQFWREYIDLKTGDLSPNAYSEGSLEKERLRGEVSYHYNCTCCPAGHACATSYVGPEHARKLAAEARRAWLRAGDPRGGGETLFAARAELEKKLREED